MNWGPFDMANRQVCVTGGGGHLGSSMAMALAEAGATVWIMGRDMATLARAAAHAEGSRGYIIPIQGDVTSDEDVKHVIERIVNEKGQIDGWVNNAYSGAGGRLLEYTREELETTTRSMADVMMATQQAAKAMISTSTDGVIVNVSSMYGLVSPYPDVYRDHKKWHNPPAYGAMKAGLIQFTRYAGVHLAKHGIRVNSITPGPFPSEHTQEDSLFVERLVERVPLARIGHPPEVAHAVLFLLSDASSYITGTNLAIDGGWTAW